MDGVTITMLLVVAVWRRRKPMERRERGGARRAEGLRFRVRAVSLRGLEQHFWQPFEIRHRFQKAKLRLRRLKGAPVLEAIRGRRTSRASAPGTGFLAEECDS